MNLNIVLTSYYYNLNHFNYPNAISNFESSKINQIAYLDTEFEGVEMSIIK